MIGLIISIIIVLLLAGFAYYVYIQPVPKSDLVDIAQADLPGYPDNPTMPNMPAVLTVPPVSTGIGVFKDAKSNWRTVNADFKGAISAPIAGAVTIDMSIGQSYIWAVNTDQKVYRKPLSGGSWQVISGSGLAKIDANENGDVWILGDNHTIWRRKESDTAATSWVRVAGGLSQIALGKTKAFGINSYGQMYWCPISNPGGWNQVAGEYRSVEAGGGQVYWVTKNFKIYRTTEANFPNGGVLVPGQAKQIAAGKDRVWALSPEPDKANDNMFSCTVPCATGDWNKIDGHVFNIDLAR
jgi:Tectonin domain